VLRVDDLGFEYEGTPALADVSFAVGPGEVLAIVGHNGAGKTTLLTLLAGLVEPDAGRVSVDGVVGFAPADPRDALFATTVREELAFFPRNRGLDVDRYVDEALSAMDLEPVADRRPTSLSTGEQRRTAIAAVLSGDPSVLALDEPTAGLDVGAADALGALLGDLEAAVVCATHDTDFAYAHADSVAVLDHGKLRAHGPAREILADLELASTAGVRPPGPVAWAAARDIEPPPDLATAVAHASEQDPLAADEAGRKSR
jgi:energy-coupling factor transporter ATP-binding protein EcfA2